MFFLHNFFFFVVLLLGIIPILFHHLNIWLYLTHFLPLNDYFFILNSLKEMKELRILESGIWVIHHHLKHRRRTIHDSLLFFLILMFGLCELVFHFGFITPMFSLFLHGHLLELFLHQFLLHMSKLLSFHHFHFL